MSTNRFKFEIDQMSTYVNSGRQNYKEIFAISDSDAKRKEEIKLFLKGCKDKYSSIKQLYKNINTEYKNIHDKDMTSNLTRAEDDYLLSLAEANFKVRQVKNSFRDTATQWYVFS